MRKCLFEAVALWLLFATAFIGAAQHFTFRTYGKAEGMTNLAPRCIVQTPKGFLYVCTEAGVFRYNGLSFQRIPLNSTDESYITGGSTDSDGNLWFSTIHALYLLNDSGAHAIPAPPDGFEFDLATSLAPSALTRGRTFFVSKHRLYATQQTGTDKWIAAPAFPAAFLGQHPELEQISFVYSDQGEHLWLGCDDKICEVNGGAFHVYGNLQGLPSSSWREAFVDSRHRLWVRSEHELYKLDNGASTFTSARLNLSPDALTTREASIIEDRQGRILLNLSAGIARLEDGVWHVLRERSDLPSYAVTFLFCDRQGSIWLSLGGHGMARWLGYNDVEDWTTINGLSSDLVWNFARDRKGRLWIATENNLERLDPGNVNPTPQTTSDRKPLSRVQSLSLSPDGHLWTGSDDGSVFDFDPDTHQSHKIAQTNGIFQVLHDRQDRMWICSLSGLSFVALHDPAKQVQTVSGKNAPQGQVYEGVEDPSGSLWFLGERGLFRLSGDQWTQIQLPAVYHSVLSAQIALAKDGTLWISGDRPALLHLNVHGDKTELLDSPPWASDAGINVFLVAIDQRGWVWAGTGDGVFVFNGQRWVRFTAADGLVWNDTNSSAFFNDNDGSVWIGTSGGITHLIHPEKLFVQEPLTAEIEDAKIGDRVLQAAGDSEVPWGHRALTARLLSLDFQRESSIAFRYRIAGLEDDWQESTQRDLRYPPLPAGSYRLEAIAVDTENGRRSEPVSFAFTVLPPWWQTKTMLVAGIGLVLLLCFLAWRWSIRLLVKQQRHLEALVQKRTQELLQEKQELLKARQKLEIQASHDSLTGILNRGAILNRFEQEIQRASREGLSLAVLLLDIDHFKQVNDTWGHTIGDRVLKEYAHRLRRLSRHYDTVGRYGGEEMIMILPGLRYFDSGSRLQALHHALCEEIPTDISEPLHITCSIGVAWYQPINDSIQSMIDRADKALYRAKNEGRNRIVFAPEPSFAPHAESHESPAG